MFYRCASLTIRCAISQLAQRPLGISISEVGSWFELKKTESEKFRNIASSFDLNHLWCSPFRNEIIYQKRVSMTGLCFFPEFDVVLSTHLRATGSTIPLLPKQRAGKSC